MAGNVDTTRTIVSNLTTGLSPCCWPLPRLQEPAPPPVAVNRRVRGRLRRCFSW
ncbi:hypothetical protein ACFWMN_12310 [Streptomyces olindensis]|uniref:hypothetical protein n=1 Tax=Streptomyces olindensis TaxID=358823 RepID=UPI003666D3E8